MQMRHQAPSQQRQRLDRGKVWPRGKYLRERATLPDSIHRDTASGTNFIACGTREAHALGLLIKVAFIHGCSFPEKLPRRGCDQSGRKRFDQNRPSCKSAELG
jgi:hypothetical protein